VLTLGYVHDLLQGRCGRIGIGGDATVYEVAENLLDSYGSPRSVYAFLAVPSRRVIAGGSFAHA
jgi:hypothetical protein